MVSELRKKRNRSKNVCTRTFRRTITKNFENWKLYYDRILALGKPISRLRIWPLIHQTCNYNFNS